MKMRPCNSPRSSGQSDDIAAFHQRSLLDSELRQMKIHCEESATVVENNASSGKKIIANQYSPAVITRADRSVPLCGARGEPLMIRRMPNDDAEAS